MRIDVLYKKFSYGVQKFHTDKVFNVNIAPTAVSAFCVYDRLCILISKLFYHELF